MPVNAISNENKQNNIYAAAGAAAAGTVGAAGGRFMAPKAAKSFDDLLDNNDVFERTMNKIKTKDNQLFAEAMGTIFPAKGTRDMLHVIVDNSFKEELIPVDEVKDFIQKKENIIIEKMQKFDDVIGQYSAKQNATFTFNQLYDDFLKNNSLTKEECQLGKTTVASIFGEQMLDTPMTMTEDIVNNLKNINKQFADIGNSELNIYKSFLKFEKDGVIAKKDMLEAVREEAKKMTEPLMKNTSFERFKKFIPRKGTVKWAAIIGIASAAIAGGAVKLFGGKTDKA